MNFDVSSLHSDNAIKIALDIFDNKNTIDDKIKALLNNRPIKNLNFIDFQANFKSGKTIDLNVSELLGIGLVASHYDWLSEEAGTGNTYQAVVGVEDSAKNQVENLLSDGAIWHDQSRKKMLAQQVMVQGYFPEKTISNGDIVNAIKKKIEQRDRYPENCMLIVNVFGNMISIDRAKIYNDIKDLTNVYTDVYLVIYNLPLLTLANVSYISEPATRGLTIKLERYEYKDEWEFNRDGKHYNPSS
jgi:hypothetical protein